MGSLPMPQATDTVRVTPATHSQVPPAVSPQHLTHTVPKLSTEAPVVSALQATLLALQATLLVLQDILLVLSMLSMEAQAASGQLASLVRLGSALQDSALL